MAKSELFAQSWIMTSLYSLEVIRKLGMRYHSQDSYFKCCPSEYRFKCSVFVAICNVKYAAVHASTLGCVTFAVIFVNHNEALTEVSLEVVQ